MRLVQVAKVLGMTGQQLRKELTEVDFGVKPTDREIPDNLAHGVMRFVARKHNLDIDFDAVFGITPEDDGSAHTTREPLLQEEESVTEEAPKEADSSSKESVHVLRKLTLDDVSKEAIAHQKSVQAPAKKKRQAPEKKADSDVKRTKATSGKQEQIKKKEGTVLIPGEITVKEFAEKTGIQVPQVVQALMKNGVMATVTQTIDYDTASIIAAELGVTVAKEDAVEVEHLLQGDLTELLKDEPENLKSRPPIVVVMGHVDHGKTSLLDAIREAEVASGEHGGITQHIGAYQVHHNDHSITFLDTPGHEAFTAMRARGTQVTDVAILVVAADDGVKETTVEAINHAKEAKVPLMVALSKVDAPGADIEKVKGELAGHGLQAEDWGGSTVMVPYSAITKQGVDDVLEHVVLLSEMAELKANPSRKAIATVIESHLDPSLGALATVIINTGTLQIGQSFVCGLTAGKVRTMMDAHGDRLEEIGPSGAVRISGFAEVPAVGDVLQIVASERESRDLARELQDKAGAQQKRSFADLVSRLSEGKLEQLKIVLKTDTHGSLEAIQAALGRQQTDEVSVKVIHGAIGAVTENDVMMASASDGIVVAFHADVSANVQRTAEREGVQLKEYDVIYKLFEDVEFLLQGLLEPEEEEKIIGHLEVKGVFFTKGSEQIIGGRVLDGLIKRVPFRLTRNGEQVGTGRITSLKKAEKDIKEAKEGSECGMRVDTTITVEEGDTLEAFVKEFTKKA